MLPKESKPDQTGQGKKSTWHWLYKHPVEFSKNNRTRSNPPSGHSFNPTRSSGARQPVSPGSPHLP
jgi:hypothetical protein